MDAKLIIKFQKLAEMDPKREREREYDLWSTRRDFVLQSYIEQILLK